MEAQEPLPTVPLETKNYRFDEAGQAVFYAWLEKLEGKRRAGDDEPVVHEHLGKYRSAAQSVPPSRGVISDCSPSGFSRAWTGRCFSAIIQRFPSIGSFKGTHAPPANALRAYASQRCLRLKPIR